MTEPQRTLANLDRSCLEELAFSWEDRAVKVERTLALCHDLLLTARMYVQGGEGNVLSVAEREWLKQCSEALGEEEAPPERTQPSETATEAKDDD